MNKIILIGHKSRQGKDTFANFLLEEFIANNQTCKIMYISTAMKEIISEALGFSLETLEKMKNENEYYRSILQYFGNGKMKKYFSDDVWVNILNQEIKKVKVNYIIIPDFRNLVEYFTDSITINISRENDYLETLSKYETSLDKYKYDFYIKNIGTLDELKIKAQKIVSTLTH